MTNAAKNILEKYDTQNREITNIKHINDFRIITFIAVPDSIEIYIVGVFTK